MADAPQSSPRKDYTAAFERELERLNPAQREAVDQIDGPVMVLAGPGTGKTHLLSARIGNILLKTDARSNNILCLTYTDAGVRAMRERLLEMIGPEAHRVNIYTFHGFCSLVIQDNLEYFGRPRLEPLSELERIRVIRAMLDGLDVHHPLRLGKGDGYFYERHLYWLFNTIKDENWTPEGMQSAIRDYLDELPNHEDFTYKRKYGDHQKGDPKTGAIATENRRMESLLAATELFADYQRRLNELGRYDFSDMIQWVLTAFEKYPLLLRSYQEKYLYLLVDEFQDTNGAQNELVRKLADFWDNPNIFIVGDDDQAIYEFQGARLRTMVEFHARYTDPALITLTDNYRSGQNILDAASVLINHNELRLGNQLAGVTIDKQLRAANPGYTSAVAPIHLLEYPDRDQENAAILQQIIDWKSAGISYSEMAVIYAAHAQAFGLQLLLEASGIPYRSKQPTNVLDETVVRQLRRMLTYFDRERSQPFSGEYELFQLLHYDCFGHYPLDLAKISLKKAREKGGREAASWREYLNAIPPEDAEDLLRPAALLRTGAWLEECILAVGNVPLSRFVESVVNGSGLLATVSRRPDRTRQLATLSSLLDFLRAELIRRPRMDLTEFLRTLDNMDDNRIGLPLRHQLVNEDAVTLVTAHSAKGLEFERVWMMDCVDKQWDNKSGGGRNQFKLPPTLTLQAEASLIEARRRLFFVGMTRARRELIISYAQLNEKHKPQTPTLFISELEAGAGLTKEPRTVERSALTDLLPLRLGAQDPAEFQPEYEKAAIADLLRDYRLSISGFNRYLKCPLSFFYETILRVPSQNREPAVFGEALHEALQDYFLRMLADPSRVFPGVSELVYYFEQAMERRRARFSEKQFSDRFTQGRRELAAYYEKYRSSWTIHSRVEQRIRDAELSGVPLSGVIDRIDIMEDDRVAIFDYKSGSQAKERLRGPTKSKPQGGVYWRQLIFYKLLYENRPGLPRRVGRSAISFLVMDSEGLQPTKEITIDKEAVDQLTKMIQEVWRGIQAQEFQGCGEAGCVWCDFERERQREIPATDPEVEALDDEVI